MAVPTFTIACTYKNLLAPGVHEMRFTKPAGFTFKAGQFVLFDVPLVDNLKDTQPRAYSIASSPDEAELLFVIKITPGGRTSNWIEQALDIGTTVVMKGPFGVFTLDKNTLKNYLFICTGTGVAPFRSQLKWALENQKDTRKMELVFGVREKKDLFWVEEFTDLMHRFPNFIFHTSLTSGEPDWDGHHGRVQQVVEQLGTDFSNVNVYICGAPEMVKDIKLRCMEDWKIPKADVRGEGYM